MKLDFSKEGFKFKKIKGLQIFAWQKPVQGGIIVKIGVENIKQL